MTELSTLFIESLRGFCKEFVEKVMVLYSDFESVLKINGGVCSPFKASRRIQQGCSLSGMLYSVAIEPLLQQIRAKINGLCIPNSIYSIKVAAYSDDVIVLVRKQCDVDAPITLLEKFNTLSSGRGELDQE